MCGCNDKKNECVWARFFFWLYCCVGFVGSSARHEILGQNKRNIEINRSKKRKKKKDRKQTNVCWQLDLFGGAPPLPWMGGGVDINTCICTCVTTGCVYTYTIFHHHSSLVLDPLHCACRCSNQFCCSCSCCLS